MQIFTLIPNNYRRYNFGFSLLELLISFVMLGLVMSLIYSAFFQISNSSIKVKSTLNSRQELRLLMKIVLDDLQSIQYLKHFSGDVLGESLLRETGLIAERKLGPENTESEKIEEVSIIFFHTAIKSLFYPDEKDNDPELHEVSYSLEENPDTKIWEFIRREDFYIDENIREGGISYVISEAVTNFELDLLESETALASGGYKENWTKVWNSEEGKCVDRMVVENFCLPRAVKLTMALRGDDGKTVSDSQVINLCVHPCNPEIFE